MPRLKIIRNICLLTIFGACLALIIIELVLQLLAILGNHQLFGFKPQFSTITWQEDKSLGQVLLTPNQQGWFVTTSKEYFTWISTNDAGFYDFNHTKQKPANTYRIILLGDSFVANLQSPLNQTIASRIQSLLQIAIPDKKFEVIPIGMGDTGTAQQYLALKSIGLNYQPDLVIHLVLTANDFKNNSFALQNDPHRPYFILDNQANLATISAQPRNDNAFKNFLKSSRLVSLFLATRQRLIELQAAKSAGYPIDYHVYDLNYTRDYQLAWAVTKRLIVESKLLTETHGSKYLLAVLANNEQVNLNLWADLNKTYPSLNAASLDLNKPDKLLQSFCLDQQLDCLFLLPEFKLFSGKNPTTPTHYRLDGHFTQPGVDLAASVISSYLKTYLLKIDDPQL